MKAYIYSYILNHTNSVSSACKLPSLYAYHPLFIKSIAFVPWGILPRLTRSVLAFISTRVNEYFNMIVPTYNICR